jgi:chromosome segregation ATPase
MPESNGRHLPGRPLEEAHPAPGGPLGPLLYLQRLIATGVEDLRGIATAVRALPEIAMHLSKIQPSVESLDREVVLMRTAVEEIRAEVDTMNESVHPLDVRLTEVRESVDRIEPELAHISRAMRPWSRARARIAGRGGA